MIPSPVRWVMPAPSFFREDSPAGFRYVGTGTANLPEVRPELEVELHDAESERVAQLLVDLSRVHHWSGLYTPGHPFLSERIATLHATLVAQVSREPSALLVLGITRDRILYHDRFLAGNPLFTGFTETLFRQHVATLAIGADVTAEGLTTFFRCLRDLQAGKIDEPPEGLLLREGVRGIHLSPVNYKQVLSRGVLAPEGAQPGKERKETLLRMLLAAHIVSEEDERKIVEELADFPDLLPVILRKAVEGPATGPIPGFVSPEVLRRMFRRLGQSLRVLPEARRREILGFLEEGIVPLGGGRGGGLADDEPVSLVRSLTRSLTDGYSDAEFLELLSALLSLEEKGGKRLLRIFEIIASERDVQGSLVPLLQNWAQESLRAKNYFAVKTWETIERLLLLRAEGAYNEEDHARFLEELSTAGGEKPRDDAQGAEAGPGPGVAARFGEEAIRRKGFGVLVELLLSEKRDPDFLVLLAGVQDAVPELVRKKDFELLDRLLEALSASCEAASAERREAARKALDGLDFHRLIEMYLADPVALKERKYGVELLVKFATVSAPPILDRLLTEEDAGRRKALLALTVRLGEPAVPAILARMGDRRWYFTRNLCYLLGEIGSPSGVPALARMLTHKELKVRREAVQSLGKLKTYTREAVSALEKVLLYEPFFFSSREEPVRIDAASALSRIGGTEAVSCLHRGKMSRRKAVRDHCEALLSARRA